VCWQKKEKIKITGEDIKNLFCPLATEKEIKMALGIVNSFQLNPFKKEVHLIKYKAELPISIVVGYEVYLKRAERTGKLDGWAVGINQTNGTAWVKIKRKDWSEPFEWEVSLTEFNKKQSTWNQIPSFMAKKVAIAQGFRLCFPDELGGMPYTQDEHNTYDVNGGSSINIKPSVNMPTAISQEKPQNDVENGETVDTENIEETSTEANSARNIYLKTIERMAVKVFGGKKKKFLEFLGQYGVEKLSELTDEQILKVIEDMKKI